MKKKEWKYQIIRGENKVEKSADDVFYTSDTEAFLVFKLEDPRLAPRQALLNLYNQNDGSVVSETVLVEDGVIEWEMREEVIVHAGNWQVQVIYEQLKDGKPEKYTAPIINFPVKNDLLNQKTTRLIAVENWHRLITNAGDLVENLEELENTYQELLDTGVLQTNINTKLEQLEEEYAPKLTEVAAQLAQKIDKGEVSVFDIDKSLGKMDATFFTDEFNANLADGTIDVTNVLPKSITKDKTDFFKIISVNKFNRATANRSKSLHPTGVLADSPIFFTTDYISSAEGSVWKSNLNIQSYAIYDSEKTLHEFVGDFASKQFTVPIDGFFRVTVYDNENIDRLMLTPNDLPTEYEPFKYVIPKEDLEIQTMVEKNRVCFGRFNSLSAQ